MDEGRYTIPTRVYLTAAERERLERLLRHEERGLDELLSALLVEYLAAAPDPPVEASPPADDGAAMLRQRRLELRRLRPKLNDPHNPAPAWLVQHAAELEAEIKRLEGRLPAS